MQGGFVQGQVMDSGPQVQDITLGGTVGLEAVKDVFVQVDAEGSAPLLAVGVGAVRGTGPLALAVAATQTIEKLQVLEHARQRQLGFDMVEVNARPALVFRFLAWRVLPVTVGT